MREVEMKAIIYDIDDAREVLVNAGAILSRRTEQSDDIYLPEMRDFNNIVHGDKVVRIRCEDGKYSITVKQPLNDELDCKEFTTNITTPSQFATVLKSLGYTHALSVRKRRLELDLENTHICLDDVVGLGTFIELEQIVDDEVEIEPIRDEFARLLVNLGIKEQDFVYTGYDTMLFNRSNVGCP